MNARGQISGATWTGDFIVVHGYLWNGRSYTVFDYPDSEVLQTLAFGINNQGQIVGQFVLANQSIHGFLRDGEKYAEITFPGSPNTAAYGINNSDEIVGLWGEAGPGPNGFAVGGRGFILRKGAFSTLDYPGAATSFALGINDAGYIVGVYQNAGEEGFHGYLATPVHRH